MLDEPLKPFEVKELMREILNVGEVTYSRPHAEERLKKWRLTTLDCVNVLRGGAVAEGEYENGQLALQGLHPEDMCGRQV